MKATKDRSEQFLSGAVQSATPPPSIPPEYCSDNSIIVFFTLVQSYQTTSV
jgi:hypothetical protein